MDENEFVIHSQQIEKPTKLYNMDFSQPSVRAKINIDSKYNRMKMSQEEIINCFKFYYNSHITHNYINTIQSLEELRKIAKNNIFVEFDGFYQNNIPKMLISLLYSKQIDLVIGVIKFMRELSKKPEQKFFEIFIQYSFFENLILSGFDYINNEIYIEIIFKFFDTSIVNFECIRSKLLEMNSLNLMKTIILNERISEKSRKLPIQTLSFLIQLPISSIQKTQIVDFILIFFNNSRYDLRGSIKDGFYNKILNDFLNILKQMTSDEFMYKNIIAKFSSICLNIIMNSKNVALCANSLLILNSHFLHSNEPIEFFTEKSHYAKLMKYAKKENDSLSRASLIVIKNMIKTSFPHFCLFIKEGLVPLLLCKFDQGCKLKVYFEVISIMAFIVEKGTPEIRFACIKSDFIHHFLSFIQVDIEKFILAAVPPLMILLETSVNSGNLEGWEKFNEDDGYSVISALQYSTIESISNNVNVLLRSLNEWESLVHK